MFSLQKPHETLRRELGGVGNPITDRSQKLAILNDQDQSYKEKEIKKKSLRLHSGCKKHSS